MKVCFIGLGSIGKRHLKNLSEICLQKEIPLEVHAWRSKRTDLDNELSSMITKSFYNVNELIEGYDIIFVTNPTHLHYETLIQVQNLSNYFFIEKPVFSNLEVDIEQFRNLTDKTFYIACPLRYTKVLKEAKKIIHNRNILSVRAISSSYLPDWRPRTDYRKTYSAHKAEGGGVCIDLIHEWDYLTDLFGFPIAIKSYDKKVSDLEIDSEDIAIYIAEYNNMLLELHLDYFGRSPQRMLEVICDDATYRFDILNGSIYKDSSIIIQFNEDPNEKYIEELNCFIDVRFNKGVNRNSLQNAYRVLSLIEKNRGGINVR